MSIKDFFFAIVALILGLAGGFAVYCLFMVFLDTSSISKFVSIAFGILTYFVIYYMLKGMLGFQWADEKPF